MKRRRYLLSVLYPFTFIPGCMSNSESEEYITSSVGITKRVCSEDDPRVDVNFNNGLIEFKGVMNKVRRNEGIESNTYYSSEEKEIVCFIRTVESTSDEVDCDGSIIYAGEVDATSKEYRKIKFLHSNREGNKIITTEEV